MSIARRLAPRLTKQILKLKDRTLLEGAMATSALVAMADGRLQLEEDLALAAVLEKLELLRVYDPSLAISLHTAWVQKLRVDREPSKREALEVVGRCAGDLEAALLLVRVGIAIAKADMDFSDEEVTIIDEICHRLEIEGLDAPALAGLRSAPRPN